MDKARDADKRRQAFHDFMDAYGLKTAPWAKKAGVSPSSIYNFLNGRSDSLSQRNLEALAGASGHPVSELTGETSLGTGYGFGLSEEGELFIGTSNGRAKYDSDIFSPQPHAMPMERVPLPPQGGRDLSVFGYAEGGGDRLFIDNGNIVDRIQRPDYLLNVREAYGVYVVGDSMLPRLKVGWLLYVDPGRPPRQGDDVVVQFKATEGEGGNPAIVKEFVSRDSKKLVLLQLNPDKVLTHRNEDIHAVHVVVGLRRL